MQIYIASSWKNQHAVEMLTRLIRDQGHTVLSFVENNNGETHRGFNVENVTEVAQNFDMWCMSTDGLKSFEYDTGGAMGSDLVIYMSPAGKDAAAEIGMAFATGVPIFGLHSKGEDFGLMRRMMTKWFYDCDSLLAALAEFK